MFVMKIKHCFGNFTIRYLIKLLLRADVLFATPLVAKLNLGKVMKIYLILILFSLPKVLFSNGLINCEILEDEYDQVKVQIIPDIELFQIVSYISNTYSFLNSLEFKYKKDIEEYFYKYKNHPSIILVQDIFKHHYSPHLIKSYLINDQYYMDTLSVNLFRFKNDIDNNYKNKLKNIDSLKAALTKFAIDTKFCEFYKNNKSYYLDKIKAVKSALLGKSIISQREKFWGMKKDTYQIIITLLEKDFHSCWFENKGFFHSVFFLTPRFQINNDVEFGNSEISSLQDGKFSATDMIYSGSGHEFGHSFLNPLTAKYVDKIENIDFEYLTSNHNTKTDFLNESILRSYTAYEFFRDGRLEIANLIIQLEIQNGFVYNDKIESLIEYYEKHRDIYTNFEIFMPYILGELEEYINCQ